MNCSHCGEPLLEEALVCPTCGTLAKRDYSWSEAAPTTSQSEEVKDPFESMAPARSIQLPRPAKIGILAGMAAIAILIIALRIAGGDSQATPKEAVKGFMHALEDQDAKKMVGYMIISQQAVPEGEDPEDWFITTYSQLFEDGKFAMNSYEILDAIEDDGMATINYKMEVTQDGRKDKANAAFQLRKEKNKWFIVVD